MKTIIFGNSGSGKSTLSKRLAQEHSAAHLDLDTLAWLPTSPPTRAPLDSSLDKINEFIQSHSDWVIEGCYSDLIKPITEQCQHLVFIDLDIETCKANAQARPWEPHKYPSKEAQDENLAMLLAWIEDYDTRDDTFSKSAHTTLFETFTGNKVRLENNQQSRAFCLK
ncbi:shikimate kinase [Pseudoalteromonas phenolica]|uniref:Shikimate kinase n=1 Tax=Pseudoalteromonas phenolica TaxID=161398 RepID=A0A5S3YQ26_9GAMM|nr:AAA family ATPase [Pseudoalteromonas phenolica]TMP78865.1 shikimate kinase [Pseudoalteromonas phenolica]